MRKFELKIDIMVSFVNLHQIKIQESKILFSEKKKVQQRSKCHESNEISELKAERMAIKKELGNLLKNIKDKA